VGNLAFRSTTTLLFVFLCATTPLLVVGSLLSERQGNTLEILLTTPEGARGAAAGKLLSRLGTVLGWTAAALPPLTVTVLFGGTSWRTLVNSSLGLLAAALELGALGLVVSACARKPATAAVFAFLLPGLHWWGAAILQDGTLAGPLGQAFAATGPMASLDLQGPALPLRYPGLVFLLASSLLALLSVPVAAAALRREEAGRGPGSFRSSRAPADGRLRAFLTGGNPVAWKESLLLNTAWSRLLFWLVLGLLLLGEGTAQWFLSTGTWDRGEDGGYLAFVGFVLVAMAAVQGAASMSHEKGGGAFELLRATPLTPTEIARGKILGTLLGMGLLLVVPAAHLLLTTLAGIHRPLTAVLAGAAALLMTANAAVHGLTWGTVARTPASALVGGASFAAFSFTGCYVLCLLPFLLAGMRLLRREGTSDFFEIIVVPAVLCGSPLTVFPWLVSLDGQRGFGVSTAFGVLFGGVGLLLCTFYLVYRWRRLPEVLGEEMARMSGGAGLRTPGWNP
jgi:ABC-type transport system involved in multi-copper enzyme maturation permease subunit